MSENLSIPCVMTFSVCDPTGGSGIQADAETLMSMGCHCSPIVTCVSVRDTTQIIGHDALSTSSLIEQTRAILEDIPIQCFKIGMLGKVEHVEALHAICRDYPHIPAVIDPKLYISSNNLVVEDELLIAVKELLMPAATITTLSTYEARLLANNADNLDACAQQLLEGGSKYLLITGSLEQSQIVRNTLYTEHRKLQSYEWQRLPYQYLGAGCTLSAAIAGLIAQGQAAEQAAHHAQEYVWESLKHSYRIGMGRHIPNRLFWARNEIEELTT